MADVKVVRQSESHFDVLVDGKYYNTCENVVMLLFTLKKISAEHDGLKFDYTGLYVKE